MSDIREVQGYRIDLARSYDPEAHLWVERRGPETVRVGMDPLGVETSGDIVQLVLQEPGTALARGAAFGSMEAAKFVGPLSMPVGGLITARNDAVLEDPRLIARDPLGEGWLLEVEPSDVAELGELVRGEEQVLRWFDAKVAEYRESGVLAE